MEPLQVQTKLQGAYQMAVHRRIKRWHAGIASLCAAVLCIGLGGCGNSTAAVPSSSGGSRNTDLSKIITAYNTWPVDAITPGKAQGGSSTRITDLLFAGLVSNDSSGKWHYDAAVSIEPNDDYTQFTVTLRPDMAFSDGTNVTSESFTKAWSYEANIRHHQPNAGYLSLISGYDDLRKSDVADDAQLSGLNIIDDTTFTIELSKPCLTFISMLAHRAFYPLPQSFYANPSGFEKARVGNGPYRLWHWDPSEQPQSMTLIPHLNYHSVNSARNDGIRFIFYSDSQKAYKDLQDGKLDVLDTVPGNKYKTFASDKKAIAVNGSGSRIQMLIVSQDYPHFGFDDEGLLRRQAVSRALKRTSLISGTMPNLALPATDFLSPGIAAYTDSLSGGEVFTYSKAQARALWAKADSIRPWGSDDGIRISYDAQADNKALYDSIARQLEDVLGVKVELTAVSSTEEFYGKIKRREISGFAGITWSPSFLTPWEYLKPLYSTDSTNTDGSFNLSGYADDDFTAMLSKALTAATASSSSSLYQSAEETLLQQLPGIPLVYKNSFGVSSATTSGFSLNSNGVPRYYQIRRDSRYLL